ncbi:MAG TPA: SDR family oxidoreductase [Pseudonocardia sp.]|jgi:NAD(P)-dependent dehydrogenase (short-subunit alcohol dehydrogenase family)
MTAPAAPVAVVTGAARGFGLEIARRLVVAGHRAVLTDVDEQVMASAESLGGTGIIADARSVADHRRVAEQAGELGPVRVWVNNAGVARPATAWEQDDADVELMVAANLLGVIHGSRVAVAAMRAHGGRLLNIASLSAHGPVPGLAVYAATKSGVLNYTVTLQSELRMARLPVRAFALCPDVADTALVRDARERPESAILFAQRRLLTAGAVADAAIALLNGRRVVRSLPASRAVAARIGALLPTVGTPVLARLRAAGEHRRARP